VAVNELRARFCLQHEKALTRRRSGNGVHRVWIAFVRLAGTVDRIACQNCGLAIGQRQHQRQVPGRMTRGGQGGETFADIGVGGYLVVCRVGPGDGAGVAPVDRAWFGAFCGGQQDGTVGKKGQAADMVDMAMGQDHKVDVCGNEIQQSQLAGDGLANGEVDQSAKGGQAIAGVGCSIIGGVGGIKACVDQDARAPVGGDQKTGYADKALARANIEGAKVEDMKRCDPVVGQVHGRSEAD
jgi:hypothetical protein